tara:strand:+ start:286 stop:468 length:183 start_codon:yes stop_codon:yes gene_type:complete
MDLPINDKELDYIVSALWKCRKSEEQCNDLYEKMKMVKSVRDEYPNGAYKAILRERGMVI